MLVQDLVLVGYTTRLRDDHALWIPEFQPNKNVTRPETAARQIEEKAQQFLEQGGAIPFFGQLATVSLYSAKRKAAAKFAYKPDNDLLGSQVVDTLYAWHPDLFESAVASKDEAASDAADSEDEDAGYDYGVLPFYANRVYFAGFEIGKFARLVALEAAEAHKRTLPTFMWSSGGYRELTNLLQPDRLSRELPLNCALQRLGIPNFVGGSPGRDADADIQTAIDVSLFLGLAPHLLDRVILPHLKRKKAIG